MKKRMGAPRGKKYSGDETDSKKIVCLDEYKNYRTNKKDFITNKMMDALADEYRAWADCNDEALLIQQFLALKGIHEKTFNTWIHKYEVLSDAHEYVLMILATRRELGLMHRRYEVSSTTFMMPHYSKDWRRREQEREETKRKNEEKGPGTVTVVMEQYGKSNQESE